MELVAEAHEEDGDGRGAEAALLCDRLVLGHSRTEEEGGEGRCRSDGTTQPTWGRGRYLQRGPAWLYDVTSHEAIRFSFCRGPGGAALLCMGLHDEDMTGIRHRGPRCILSLQAYNGGGIWLPALGCECCGVFKGYLCMYLD
jgi:hypothetical protein